MIHEVLPVGPIECNCSILGDETSGDAFVIDPGDDVSKILQILKQRQLKVKAILITHAHIDHIGGAAKLKAATGAPVYMNTQDQELYDNMAEYAAWLGMEVPDKTDIDVETKDGQVVKLHETEFHVMHTPGHTQGSLCLFAPSQNLLLAGDTLFQDSIGRTDLPGGDSKQILKSIRTQLLTLPDETVVIPGHGPATTIGRERERNPFLRGL